MGGDEVTIVILYVDDLLLIGNRPTIIRELKAALSKQYKMTDLGPVSRFLGLRITRNRSLRRIDIDQEEYIQAVLERFEMADAVPTATPLPSGAVLEANPGEVASDHLRVKYQSLIGSLLYAMLGTRPDVAFAVTRLSKFNNNPSSAHFKFAQYICRYLRGTIEFRLRFAGDSNAGLVTYVDSDWAENRDDRHSIAGQVSLMAGAAISWVSRRQPTVAHSSTEAEYMSASDACRQIAWLRNFGIELGDDMEAPTLLCVDNHGAIFLSVNPAHDRRTKHVDIRYHYIREFIEQGRAEVYYVESAENVADILTKNVPLQLVTRFSGRMGLVSATV